MYEAARDRLGEGRCLGAGDPLEIDVLGARRRAADSAPVPTGGATRTMRTLPMLAPPAGGIVAALAACETPTPMTGTSA